MAMVTSVATSNNNTTISRSLSVMENNTNSRDVSFSSYLNGAEQTFFLLNITESNQTSNSPNGNICIGESKVHDGHEIGVFSAEKYFQGEMDNDKNSRIGIVTPKIHHDKNDPILHPKFLPGTPSIRSETSWNSQSALLTRSPKNQPRGTRNRVHRKSFLSNIGCNCYCKDKKSVDIDEGHVAKSEISKKSLSKTWAEEKMSIDKGIIAHSREEIFSFPVLGDSINPKKDHEGNKIHVSSRSLSMEIKKKERMLMWETDEEINTKNTHNDAFNDNASDASSDLFEIESFSTNTNSYLARESSTCYAPSEVSIEWSVVTADYDDTRSNTTAVRSLPVRDIQKRRQGILPSCKSQKSVNVVGSIIDPPHRNHRLNSAKHASRFQPEREIGLDRIRTVSSRNKNLLYI